jgi:hypothetical protein
MGDGASISHDSLHFPYDFHSDFKIIPKTSVLYPPVVLRRMTRIKQGNETDCSYWLIAPSMRLQIVIIPSCPAHSTHLPFYSNNFLTFSDQLSAKGDTHVLQRSVLKLNFCPRHHQHLKSRRIQVLVVATISIKNSSW